MSGLLGSSEKHDLPVRTRYLPNVWRPDVGVSDMSQGGRQAHSALLKIKNRPAIVARWIFPAIMRERIKPTTFRGYKRKRGLCFFTPRLFLTTFSFNKSICRNVINITLSIKKKISDITINLIESIIIFELRWPIKR